ncbi:MAG: protein O-mannosyl-transferase family, partial [Anaerolineae bacterium]
MNDKKTSIGIGPTRRSGDALAPALAASLFALAGVVYVLTAAPGTLFGDPSEYQFIPAIWGIAHPPGYAFYTLLAGVWQRLVAVGTVAYRTNLLAGAAGAWTVSRITLITFIVAQGQTKREAKASRIWALLSAVAAGVGLALMPDLWQHSIHANAHIVSVAITSTQLWLLVRWQENDRIAWLFALALLVGIGVAHHPITVWGVPAYGAFILLHRPRTLTDLRTMIGGVICGLLGLLPWIYFPLRSPDVPFGPTDMGTWSGFLRHATAQGLRVNLFHFGPVDWPDRWLVFFSLLKLQYSWVLVALILLGMIRLMVRRTQLGVLWTLFLLGHLGFTLNSVQDVMAYLLHPFAALGLPLGLGVLTLVEGLGRKRIGLAFAGVALLGLVLSGRAIHIFPRISMARWRDADQFVMQLHERFKDEGEGAAFVSDWEHLTPYFYWTYVEDLALPPEDLRPVYVTGASPWTESVFVHLPAGDVYLSNYRRDIRELGFRLRPEGGLWRVLERPAIESVDPMYPLDDIWVDGSLELLGYDLPVSTIEQGGVVPLTLYARTGTTETHILMPFGVLGEVEQRWTTDSRRLTPDWQPGEIIAERYEVFVPYSLPPGRYPLSLGYADLTEGRGDLSFTVGGERLVLGSVDVTTNPRAPRESRVLARSLANMGNDVALVSSLTRSSLAMRWGDWDAPLRVR